LKSEVVRGYWINVAQERVEQPSVLSTVENLQVYILLCNVFNQNIEKKYNVTSNVLRGVSSMLGEARFISKTINTKHRNIKRKVQFGEFLD